MSLNLSQLQLVTFANNLTLAEACDLLEINSAAPSPPWFCSSWHFISFVVALSFKVKSSNQDETVAGKVAVE